MQGDYTFIPLDELLGFIVDQHFPNAAKRRDLHTKIRETREQLRNTGKEFQVTMGRIGTLYLTCKNPVCAAQMMSDVKAGAYISHVQTAVTLVGQKHSPLWCR
jgi:hypothetical protein